MAGEQVLWLYLDPGTLADVAAGRHNFFGRVIAAVTARGWRVELRESTLAERVQAPLRAGYALFHMEEPTHPGALTCRRTYTGAFWHIEAVAARWDWPVARATYRPDPVRREEAREFADRLRRRLGAEAGQEAGAGTEPSGAFIYVPLQARLLAQRSFQAASPVEMLRETLARTDLPILATLHPKATYSDEERGALRDLCAASPRLRVQATGSEAALRACKMVVTQNSGLAFHGYAFHKPAVLFARADFHHIAGSVPEVGAEAAFARLDGPPPDFDDYLYWFLQLQAINAGRDDCGDRIVKSLRGHGWKI
jgi:hypothetical protein